MADNLEQIRDEVYQRLDAWILTHRDLEAAIASGDPDEITAADEALYEAALAVAEPVLGDLLRDRMWREIEPHDLSPADDKFRYQLVLGMLRQFLMDTVPLGLREVSDPFINAAWEVKLCDEKLRERG